MSVGGCGGPMDLSLQLLIVKQLDSQMWNCIHPIPWPDIERECLTGNVWFWFSSFGPALVSLFLSVFNFISGAISFQIMRRRRKNDHDNYPIYKQNQNVGGLLRIWGRGASWRKELLSELTLKMMVKGMRTIGSCRRIQAECLGDLRCAYLHCSGYLHVGVWLLPYFQIFFRVTLILTSLNSGIRAQIESTQAAVISNFLELWVADFIWADPSLDRCFRSQTSRSREGSYKGGVGHHVKLIRSLGCRSYLCPTDRWCNSI